MQTQMSQDMLGFEEELLKAVPWQALEDIGSQQALEVDAKSAGHVCFVATLGLDARASTGHDRKCPFLGKIVIACQVRPCVPIECASQLSVFACRFECPFRCAQLTHLRWSSGRSVTSSSFGACRRNGNATMPTRASPLQIRCGDTTFQKLHLYVFSQSLDVAFAPPFKCDSDKTNTIQTWEKLEGKVREEFAVFQANWGESACPWESGVLWTKFLHDWEGDHNCKTRLAFLCLFMFGGLSTVNCQESLDCYKATRCSTCWTVAKILYTDTVAKICWKEIDIWRCTHANSNTFRPVKPVYFLHRMMLQGTSYYLLSRFSADSGLFCLL